MLEGAGLEPRRAAKSVVRPVECQPGAADLLASRVTGCWHIWKTHLQTFERTLRLPKPEPLLMVLVRLT